MCALAHYFEDEGLATVVVALVREHAQVMRPPRALWVPFELGRPFGVPRDPAFQTRVLRAALDLFDRPGPEPHLADYAEEAPDVDSDSIFPAPLDTASVSAEAAGILPIWERIRDDSGRTTVGISGLSPIQAVEFIARFHSDDPMPNPGGMASVSRARFAIDDIKAFYLEAGAGNARPPSRKLLDWFWETTLAGAMVRAFQETARTTEDKNLKLIAGSLVPSERVNSRR